MLFFRQDSALTNRAMWWKSRNPRPRWSKLITRVRNADGIKPWESNDTLSNTRMRVHEFIALREEPEIHAGVNTTARSDYNNRYRLTYKNDRLHVISNITFLPSRSFCIKPRNIDANNIFPVKRKRIFRKDIFWLIYSVRINVITQVDVLLEKYHIPYNKSRGWRKRRLATHRNRNLYSAWAEGCSQWQPCWTDRSDSCRFQPSRNTHVRLVPSTRLRS